MTKKEILHNAKRWAKRDLLNEPLLAYWNEYRLHEEVSFTEFKNLVLTGKKSSGNVVSITKNKPIQPAMGISAYLQHSIEKERTYG